MKNQSATYEPPTVKVIGKVEVLTKGQDKRWGSSDGFTLLGAPIMNNSG